VVEVNDHGDARIAMGHQSAMIMLDGVLYLIQADLLGIYAARWDDLTALLTERIHVTMPPVEAPDRRGHPPASPVPAFIERGTEIVAGRTGTLWSQRVDNGHGQPVYGVDVVISSDPDLAPLGHIFARQFETAQSGLRTMLGSGAAAATSPNFGDQMRVLLARGAPLRMGNIMRLESVDTRPIPASEFVLPGSPLTRAQLEARLGWGPVSAAPGDRAH